MIHVMFEIENYETVHNILHIYNSFVILTF